MPDLKRNLIRPEGAALTPEGKVKPAYGVRKFAFNRLLTEALAKANDFDQLHTEAQ